MGKKGLNLINRTNITQIQGLFKWFLFTHIIIPFSQIKPGIATQHSQAGGAVSFASFSQHTGSKGPIYAAPAVAPQYATYPHQYSHVPQQYVVSGGYKVAASQPAQVYAQIPYTSGAIQYGSHLVQPEQAKITYQQVQHQRKWNIYHKKKRIKLLVEQRGCIYILNKRRVLICGFWKLILKRFFFFVK